MVEDDPIVTVEVVEPVVDVVAEVVVVTVVMVFEFVDDVAGSVEVETVIATGLRFNVRVPGPLRVTSMGLLEPVQTSSPVQFQLESA